MEIPGWLLAIPITWHGFLLISDHALKDELNDIQRAGLLTINTSQMKVLPLSQLYVVDPNLLITYLPVFPAEGMSEDLFSYLFSYLVDIEKQRHAGIKESHVYDSNFVQTGVRRRLYSPLLHRAALPLYLRMGDRSRPKRVNSILTSIVLFFFFCHSLFFFFFFFFFPFPPLLLRTSVAFICARESL